MPNFHYQSRLLYVEICTLDPKLCTEPPYDHKGKMSQLHARKPVASKS